MSDRDTQYEEEDTASITMVAPPGEDAPESQDEFVVGATLTVLTGPSAGQRHLMIGSGGIGRAASNEVSIEDPTISRLHAMLDLEDDGYRLRDLGSRNGTFLDGVPVDRAGRAVPSTCRIRVGTRVVLQLSTVDQLGAEVAERIQRTLHDDPLTGLGNRASMERRLVEEVSFARRHEQPLGALMLDLDHFKRINDRYGHHAGDQVLRAVGQAVRATIRLEDAAFRYGGEELAILVRGIPEPGMVAMAERIRVSIEQLQVRLGERVVEVTVSIGAAMLRPAAADPGRDLLARADTALYQAKRAGRNRTVLERGFPAIEDGDRPTID